MIEDAADAFHDREAEFEPARPARLIEPMKFTKIALLTAECPDSIVDVDTNSSRGRQPISTQPAGVYLIAFDTRFAAAAQQPPVGRTARARHEGRFKSLRAPDEFDLELAHHLVDAEVGDLRFHRAGIEPGDIEQGAQNLFHGFERGVDIGYQPRVLAAALPLDQAGDVKPRGVERLQDVVAGGGEEARLGNVGFLGLSFGLSAALPDQFLGAP
jgi:hypothetical protein